MQPKFFGYRALCACFLVILATGCAPPLPKKSELTGKLIVGGSGSAYPTLTALTTAFIQQHPRVQISFQPSSQSTTAVKYVTEGKIDIGAIARSLNESERTDTIIHIPIARDGIVLAVHPNVKITDLTSAQIRDIYSGKIQFWSEVGGPSREIVVLGRAEGETSRTALSKSIFGGGHLFSPEVTVLPTEQDMFESVAVVADAIGYFSYSYIVRNPGKVRMLAVDSRTPSVETLQSGTYPITRPIGMVVRSNQRAISPLREFLEFMDTLNAREALLKEGLIPEDKP